MVVGAGEGSFMGVVLKSLRPASDPPPSPQDGGCGPTTAMGLDGDRGPGQPQGQLPSQGGWEPARQSSRQNSNSPVGTASFTAPEEALFESRRWGEGAGLGVRRSPHPPHPTV